MKLQLDYQSKTKNSIHAVQSSLLAIAMILTIAIFTRPGNSDGRVGWYFGLCWLTIPILIYLVMVPMWSRARRFSNVYAFASLDGLSVLLWLTAWASMASYIASGKGRGEKEGKSGCDNFKYGSPGRCKLSTGVMILGVLIMVLFAATAFFSFKNLMTYKRTGLVPMDIPKQNEVSVQTQEAFSSNMHTDEFDDDRDPSADARQGGYAYQQPHVDEEYAPIYQNEHDDIGHLNPAQPLSPLGQNGLGINNSGTSYRGAYGQRSPILSPDGDPRADYGKYGRNS